jgi:hypothetical protein
MKDEVNKAINEVTSDEYILFEKKRDLLPVKDHPLKMVALTKYGRFE